MKFFANRHRKPYVDRNPYAAVLESVPESTVQAVREQLQAGEHPLDVAFANNLLVGVVELVAEQLRGETSSKKRALTVLANMLDDDLHRVRTRLDIGDSVEQIAEDEDLSIDVVALIKARSEAAAARRAARSGTTMSNETPERASPMGAQRQAAPAGSESSDFDTPAGATSP